MAKKPNSPDVDDVPEKANVGGIEVLLWKANRPLTVEEHEHLSEKLSFESMKSGIPIVLVPFSVETETAIAGDPVAADE
ncbi:hypothetical protein [Paenibacillus gansuensis]|uniref:Uncharacterized protein n=1 Tax=Paenibacillus gansuensis TaxID=306542 RepID=A0ABW5PI29_9BACL